MKLLKWWSKRYGNVPLSDRNLRIAYPDVRFRIHYPHDVDEVDFMYGLLKKTFPNNDLFVIGGFLFDTDFSEGEKKMNDLGYEFAGINDLSNLKEEYYPKLEECLYTMKIEDGDSICFKKIFLLEIINYYSTFLFTTKIDFDMIAPYDSGVDVFIFDSKKRSAIKKIYEEYLSHGL